MRHVCPQYDILIDPDHRGVIWTNLDLRFMYIMMLHINNSTNFTPTILLKTRSLDTFLIWKQKYTYWTVEHKNRDHNIKFSYERPPT